MQSTLRRVFLLALIGAGVLGAGCGRSVGSSGIGASPSVTPGASSRLVSGQVTLVLNKQHYQAGDTITVTINNRLSQTIWAADHQSDCTVLTAERLQGDLWQAVGACRLMTPTCLVALSSASITPEHLAIPQASSCGDSWPRDTYRVTLSYTGGARLVFVRTTSRTLLGSQLG